MKQQRAFPRYAGLARKALLHYLGNRYNPHEMDCALEYLFRRWIKGCVELKVIENEPYDWGWIDNFFRMVLYNEGYTDLVYDDSIIEKGYNGVERSKLPVYQA